MTKTPKKVTRTAPAAPVAEVIGGVDTHRDFHVAAAKDSLGPTLGTRSFPATSAGYAALVAWLAGFGPISAVGVEGTGCYGAGLSTYLIEHGITVVEVNRPNRQKRRRAGKSDPRDAINAAAAVQSGDATAAPKTRTGPIESVRVLRQTRDLLVTARTRAINTLKALLVTAPAPLRESLHGLSTTALLTHCAAFDTPTADVKGLRGKAKTQATTDLAEALLDPGMGVRTVLGELARIIAHHNTHIAELDIALDALVHRIAPRTTALFGLGPDTTGQLLTTVSDNPDRIHSEPALATLTGVAPQDCSSGRTQDHHRLSRAGDRQANAALYRTVLTRLAWHEPTRTYMTTRLTPNASNKKHLIRCLKRYLIREIYPHLTTDLATLHTA
ncbi:Transposase [Allokutzneria albata]|uniref:Transposase n=2 Tax=Allokutzneria albata TaxID=211114 RepID=A0A1G9UDJ6_ALLAB|nr:Transposase [Allokutzneria albata]